MTSKEAFEIIFYYFWTRRNKINKYEYEAITNSMNKLENDLEVLEILKNESDNKRIIIKDNVASFHLNMVLTTDNYNKVKEWLENE